MTVYCLIEIDHLQHTKVLGVYTSALAAFQRVFALEDDGDGRHWYRVEESEMEGAA